eukprot:Tamp_05738.p2 GENE.Tamp_05738~~Tamp_05738.p2  ORF type:complete len:318 (+),score=34.79 Tamp_05738:1470-2423(+)
MHTLIQGQPDVCVRELTQEDRFVIMATQGVWKFLTKQEAVELVGQHQGADDASWELVSEARRRAQLSGTMIDHNNVHCEDATAIVFFFGEQGMRDTRAKGTKQGRRMTFQSQSKMHKIDVPSDLVSSNFEMWMQQEEARVLVSPKPQSCMFNTETMMCQPPSVLIMLCTRLTSQVGRLTICSHVHVCLYLGSQAAQHMKELYKEIFMEDDAPSASASSTAIPSSGRVASSATGRRLGMAPTLPTSPPMNPISHRGNHAKSPPAEPGQIRSGQGKQGTVPTTGAHSSIASSGIQGGTLVASSEQRDNGMPQSDYLYSL